jgi:adhesin/invasin
MSRTTKALKRLGVPGLAAVTLVAGLPLFLGTAQAAPIGTLTITPVDGNDSGAAGSCQAYYVDAAPATANTSTVGETVNIILTDATGSATSNADFCTAPTGDATPAAGTVISTGGAQTGGGSTDQREFTLAQNGTGNNTGRVVIGVTRNQPGNVTIQAYSDVNNNNAFNAGEPQTQRSTAFTAGGDAGSNTNQDAATSVEVIPNSTPATATVTVDADGDIAVEGETRTYRVLVRNAAGDRLAGATVNFAVDSNINTADRGSAVFGTTDNNGIATGTITFPERTVTGDSTDNVTFFVNQTGLASTPNRDVGEPFDTLTVTVRDNAQQVNRTVTLTALDDTTFPNNSNGPAVNEARDTNRTFRAVVDSADTTVASTVGTELSFRVTGGSGDETVTPAETATTAANGATADANDSFVDVVVNDPTPTVGQTLTVTATIRGTSATATATLTFRNRPEDARSISLTPETVTAAPNTATQLSATVRDVDGNPVPGVVVRFTESGAGAFRNGSSQVDVTTNASGVATIETISLPGETGTQTVTATIQTPGTQCGQAANTGTDPQGNALNATTNTGAAGVCSDTSTVTFGAAASPSATPTSTSTTPPVPCTTPATVTLERTTITATGSSGVTVRATANSVVDLFAYSRPSTTYRVVRSAEVGADGVAEFRIVPPTNTRLYAQQRGCSAGQSVVLNVRTQLSLNVVRNGTRNYTFSGRALPARNGGLIVSLYRVTANGNQILTSQTRANASTGVYSITRQFTGSGRFGFVVRTGQDLQNAPGASNVRSLLVF